MSDNFRINQLLASQRASEVARNARHGWRRPDRSRRRRSTAAANAR